MNKTKYAYHKELDAGGTYYYADNGKLYFMPKTTTIRNANGPIETMNAVLQVLILAEQIIPLIVRLWLMIFGSKEQKKLARQHARAAAAIREAKKVKI